MAQNNASLKIHKIRSKSSKNFLSKFSLINKFLIAMLTPLIILVVWEIGVRLGYVKVVILPAPSSIFNTFVEMIKSGELVKHMRVSLLRVVEGFLIGTTLGLIFGIIIALSKKLEIALSFTISFLRPIPIIAWIPVLILWMGIDEGSKIAVIAIGSFWPVLINTIDGIKSVDKKYLEVSTVLEKNRIQTLLNVVLPSALPHIFTGIRISVGVAWMCVVAAELVAAESGIGYQIMYAREIMQPEQMFTGVFSIGLVGFLIEKIIKKIEVKALKWNVNMKS
ncbi:ABC-type nitrate/sulfonate/bicarbonate transport system, permease component [Gottschalkia purinilytica]|uniref:ABC-type nitrate/sulfonate/bicarbonate transport system, permease component n=1 Tax=Gottschalkia purinilytica TaxID=1503 RepID=A0A0L0W6P9_GOTPU|nr:ABC transporter permease [Gottschalkia purinilytica]KNF07199.1 ABC-type nitrate/sulfonate/bicarbonate transport system, permease component [Gottschalkia purinilytica]